MLSSAVSTRMSKGCDFVSLWIHCAIWTCLCCFDAISEFHNHAQNTRMNMAPNHETSLLGHALPQTWWIVWKKLFVSEKKCRKCHVCCAVLHYISYAKFSQILRVLWDSHRLFGSRNSPTTGTLHSISAMFTSVCGPSEKRLALPLCLNILRMIVKLAYW